MKRTLYNLLAVLLMAAFVIFLIIGNVFRVSVSIVTPKGSYAEQYAKKHHLKQINAPDTLKDGTELKYETFTYNISAGMITLEKYNGVGREVVVPISIDGFYVAKLGENFFRDSPTISTLYLAPDCPIITCEAVDGITLYVNGNSKAEEQLTEAGWAVKTYPDSDMPIFTLGDVPFEYNVNSNGIELVHYTGKDDALLIPAYIDGKPVTKIAFDMLGFSMVSFPATVTEITGKTDQSIYTTEFAVELIFTIMMFIAVLAILNAKLPLLKNKEEFMLSGPQLVLSYLFFVAQLIFALIVIYRRIVDWKVAGLVSIILLIVYLLLVLMAGQGRKHAVTVTEKNVERTRFMDGLKLSVANLADDISDKEAKKQVARLVEEIQFSDPTDNQSLTEIQTKLRESVDLLKEIVDRGDAEEILRQCEVTMKVLKERNSMCKAGK